MAQDTKTREKQTSPPAAEDLSAAIVRAVDRQPDEEVRSVRVFGDYYRCNWWVQDRSRQTMLAVSSGTIRKSRFLRATRSGGELVIEDISRN